LSLEVFKRFLLLLGAFSVLLGQGVGFSLAAVEKEPMIFMGGPMGHAMKDENLAEDMNDCLDMDCQDCKMANCSISHCTNALFHEMSTVNLTKVNLTNAQGAPPSLTGIDRLNLPLPPP